MKLSDEQRAAVETTSGRVLVAASAGSGKTATITERVALLIEKRKVSPFEIMQFTFTRLASNEMRQRLKGRIGNQAHRIALGTMHGLALGYLKRFGDAIGWKAKQLTVYSQWESDFLLKESAKQVGAFNNKWIVPKKDIVAAVNHYYSTGKEPHPNDPAYPTFRAFTHFCRENNSMTYDGLLIGMELLIPTIAKHLKIRHLLVDEVQDISCQQWRCINAMVKAFDASLFVCGDDSQSLYSFRGAVPEYMVDHQSEFDIYNLSTNYRSVPAIVNSATRLIKNNKDRIPLEMKPHRAGEQPVSVIENMDSRQLVKFITEMPFDPKETAVLCRIRAPLKKLSRLLEQSNIEHDFIGNKSELTNSEYFRRFHAFLKLSVNYYDNFAFLLVYEILGLTTTDLTVIRQNARETAKSDAQAYASMHRPTMFDNMQDAYGDDLVSWATVIDERMRKFPWKDPYMVDKSRAFSPTHNFTTDWCIENPQGTISSYLEWLATFDLQDEVRKEQTCLELLTAHGAKGLQWKNVIVAGCNEGILPSKQAIMADNIDDERRIAYVAMTRAEDQLMMTVRPEKTEDARGNKHNNPVSRFIGEART